MSDTGVTISQTAHWEKIKMKIHLEKKLAQGYKNNMSCLQVELQKDLFAWVGCAVGTGGCVYQMALNLRENKNFIGRQQCIYICFLIKWAGM